jgi:phosphoribosyl 1,2-cyclic phosphodiesterase
MRLTVLGSGSRGNAVLVSSGDGSLLVDAGFSLRDIRRRMEAAGVASARPAAIALTHEHQDHSRGAARAALLWNAPVLATPGTLAALGRRLKSRRTVALEASRAVSAGPFTITAFPTAHDAADPAVLVIEDSEGIRVAVAFDVGSPTTALRLALKRLDALIIETNHDEVMLRASAYPPAVRARIAGQGGHLSNRQAALLAREAVHPRLSVVVLAHLSDQCNLGEVALAEVGAALRSAGFRGRLVVAEQDAPTPTVEVGAVEEQLALALGRGS